MKAYLLARLQHQPAALDHLLDGLTEAQFRQRPQSDKWSIFEHVAHLGRYQNIFVSRVTRIDREDNPAVERYVAEADPGFAEWTGLPYADLMERIREERRTLNTFLGLLHDAQLRRTARHPLYGPMTVEGWTEFFLLHEAHHLFAILRLAGSLGRTL